MSIRPTDLQIIVQKAQEVERLQQAQQQQEKVQQQQFAEQLHKQDAVKKNQISTAKHADEIEIHTKEKSSDQGSSHKKQRQKPDDEEKENSAKGSSGQSEHIIDITI